MKAWGNYLILLTFYIAGCTGLSNEIPSTCEKEGLYFSKNIEVEICLEDSAVLTDGEKQITYQYLELVEDSRCPEADSINCVWAGRAIVQLGIDEQKFELGVGDLTGDTLLQSTVDHQGYKTVLVDVKPFASEAHPGEDKSIVIKVEAD